MKPIKNGKIVAITDKSVDKNPAYYGAYGVAKTGLKQLMQTVSAEHCEQCLNCYIADLNPFATQTRGRLFPGENPTKLTQVDEVADYVIKQTINGSKTFENSEIGTVTKLK